jgi:DNA ligase D-like protein (predicted 3'-phosphoesterase)
MPRFVLLFHESPAESSRESHWDFMVETGGVLRTWALTANPAMIDVDQGDIAAEQLPDHRLDYLEYEGPISQGRGRVEQVDAGQFEVLSETEFELALNLTGEKLNGEWSLIRDPSAEPDHWLFSRILNSRAT